MSYVITSHPCTWSVPRIILMLNCGSTYWLVWTPCTIDFVLSLYSKRWTIIVFSTSSLTNFFLDLFQAAKNSICIWRWWKMIKKSYQQQVFVVQSCPSWTLLKQTRDPCIDLSHSVCEENSQQCCNHSLATSLHSIYVTTSSCTSIKVDVSIPRDC